MPSPKAPSAKLLARRAVKVVMNRAALDEISLATVDGLLEMTREVMADAMSRAPRDPETAERRGVPMMADTGTVGAWAGGKKVGGDMTRKPRGVKNDLVVVGAFASPVAHLIEGGTIKMTARPFLTPALLATLPDAQGFVRAACIKRGVG